MARDRFQQTDFIQVRIRLLDTHQTDERQYNLPTTSEVAALIIGDGQGSKEHCDVIVQERGFRLRIINEMHPSFMAMQYPILFPYAKYGYRVNISHRIFESRRNNKQTRLSMREYYAFRIQQRKNEGLTLVKSGRLFQQFLVDAYTCIEDDRLQWCRKNQKKIRAELYQGLQDAIVAGDTTPASVGMRLILPSFFTRGPRYMIQNYQDAMTICKWAGPPDLFITFTCNPK